MQIHKHLYLFISFYFSLSAEAYTTEQDKPY